MDPLIGRRYLRTFGDSFLGRRSFGVCSFSQRSALETKAHLCNMHLAKTKNTTKKGKKMRSVIKDEQIKLCACLNKNWTNFVHRCFSSGDNFRTYLRN